MKKHLKRLFEDTESRAFWLLNDFLAAVIIISSLGVLFETDPLFLEKYGELLFVIDVGSAAIFLIEYVIYLVITDKKWSYIFSFYGIIDLLSFLPTFLGLLNLQFLKVLRVSRLLRLLKMFRTLKFIKILKLRMSKEKKEMNLLKMNVTIYFTTFFVIILIASVIIFEIEHLAIGTQIHSIIDAIWLTLSATTSVGFGDIVPVTLAGRTFMGFVMISGVAFLSFAVVIIGKFLQKVIFGGDIEKEMRAIK